MRVLILRPKELLDETLEKFRKEGIEAYGCAFIKIEQKNFDIPDHDIAIVMSQISAKMIVNKGLKLKKVIAIGEKTAEVLRKGGHDVLIPRRFDSETIVADFADLMRGKRVVAIRSNSGSDILRKIAEIADYREIYAYDIVKIKGEEQRRELERVVSGFYDVIVFSSRLIAESFLESCDINCIEKLKNIALISIGKPTADFLKEKGYDSITPEEYTFDGILKLIKSLRGVNFRC
ncbi:MAG: uroporphyrinogen-III synthase [Archaeoglobaceae archaeon]|nr:uroporphyrinogen-III synthase [Archaeoglobaceae archaeon]MDW7989167.1 uroporphyrinogen-III synthase [Archaeoglobaceae archaeon]